MTDRRAAGYIRVSTFEQAEEGLSLATQEATIRAHCAATGLQLVQLVTDDGVSAGKPLAARPGGAVLIDQVRRGAAQIVIATRLDRLFRNTLDCLAQVQSWDEQGVTLRLLDLGGEILDTGSAFGRFFLTVMVGVAELERGILRERTRAALTYRASQGIYHASVPPFGMMRTAPNPDGPMHPRARSEFRPDPNTAPILREIFARWTAGEPSMAIARQLARRGVRGSRGSPIRYNTIEKIVLNPIYIGMLAPVSDTLRQPEKIAANVEPLLSVEEWEAAQEVWRLYHERGLHPRQRGSSALFSGLLTCDACDCRCRLWGGPSNRRHPHYRCGNALAGICDQPGIREDVVWDAILPMLLRALDPKRIERRRRSIDQQAEQQRRRVAEIDARLLRLAEGLSLGMTAEEYRATALPLRDERDRLARELQPEPDVVVPLVGTSAELRRALTQMDKPGRRRILLAVGLTARVRSRGVVSVRMQH